MVAVLNTSIFVEISGKDIRIIIAILKHNFPSFSVTYFKHNLLSNTVFNLRMNSVVEVSQSVLVSYILKIFPTIEPVIMTANSHMLNL